MKVKKRILGLLVILSLAIITGVKMNIVKNSAMELVWMNIEALADVESESDLDCKGWFGWCSYTCPKCGVGFSALGDHMVGTHKCNQ